MKLNKICAASAVLALAVALTACGGSASTAASSTASSEAASSVAASSEAASSEAAAESAEYTVYLQCPAQRGGHGLGGDGLPAGVQQLPPRCFVHEPADVLPAGQLLRRLCGKCRRLCAGAAAAEPRMTL